MRYLSFPLVWVLQFTPITPNMVSVGCHLFTILASFLFVYNSIEFNLIALLCLHLAVLCDFVDGSLARAVNRTSKFIAHYADRIFHEVTTALIFIGIGYGTGYIVCGFIAALGLVSGSYIFQLRNWLLSRYGDTQVTEYDFEDTMIEGKMEKILLKGYYTPMKYFRFVLLIFILIQKLDIFIIVYSIFLPLRMIGGAMFFYLKFWRMDHVR